MEGYITAKSPKVFMALMGCKYSAMLVAITEFIIGFMLDNDIPPVITSAYRQGDSGVHGDCRGIDFRTWDISPALLSELCSEVNSNWVYDPNRPEKEVLIYHDVGRGPHLHCQVHPNTQRRKAEI